MTQWLGLASRWGGAQLSARAVPGATRRYISSLRASEPQTEGMQAAGAGEIGDCDDDWELLYGSSV